MPSPPDIVTLLDKLITGRILRLSVTLLLPIKPDASTFHTLTFADPELKLDGDNEKKKENACIHFEINLIFIKPAYLA